MCGQLSRRSNKTRWSKCPFFKVSVPLRASCEYPVRQKVVFWTFLRTGFYSPSEIDFSAVFRVPKLRVRVLDLLGAMTIHYERFGDIKERTKVCLTGFLACMSAKISTAQHTKTPASDASKSLEADLSPRYVVGAIPISSCRQTLSRRPWSSALETCSLVSIFLF